MLNSEHRHPQLKLVYKYREDYLKETNNFLLGGARELLAISKEPKHISQKSGRKWDTQRKNNGKAVQWLQK